LRRRPVQWLVSVAVNRRRLILVGWGCGLAVLAIGVTRVQVETDVIRWFSSESPIRRSYEEITNRLSGISPVNILIEAQNDQAVSASEVVARIDSLAAYLGDLPEVGKVLSVADPLRQIHGGFLDDASSPLPQGDALIEQYLLVLESSEYMRDLITEDRRVANIILRINDNASAALRRVARRAEEWWAANGVSGFDATATGIMFEFARAEDEIAWGQLKGLGFAVATIALILFGILGSGRVACIALLVNVAPVAMIFGAMGFLGIPLDAGTVVVGSLALGIAVDDTIHILEAFQYRMALEPSASGVSVLAAALGEVLPAIVYTTVAVGLGFVVLCASGFTFTRSLGALIFSAVCLCLMADLLFLPALLLRRGKQGVSVT
jgi:predicted RND superfamily exporter protein